MKELKRIEYTILSHDDIIGNSYCHVTNSETLSKDGKPTPNGLCDPRMGALQKYDCYTCEGNIETCTGHFGHILFGKPIYHPRFLDTAKQILEIICSKCSRIKKKNTHKANIRYWWEQMKSVSVCEHCTKRQPKYKKTAIDIQMDSSHFNAEKCRSLFNEMTHYEMYEILDLNFHPSDLILTALPIPPPCIRPTINFTVSVGEDDLTRHLQNIIQHNNELTQRESREIWEVVQMDVAFYFDSNIQIKHKQLNRFRPAKSIISRLKTKEGRIRSNLMGKRVDFCARTVITGDPTLDVDQLGVPMEIALNLTFPEKVTPLSLYHLQELVDTSDATKGDKKPIAKNVIRKKKDSDDEIIIDLTKRRQPITLEIGDTVERTLKNDDYVVFNRQPSLHKFSMMAHRVKILKGNTFRTNLSVCAAYNSDFDGDEMNMFVPQSLEAIAEIKELMNVNNCIITPQNNSPIIGIVQDSLLGSFISTNKSIFLEKEQVFDLYMQISTDSPIMVPSIMKPKPLWTGKDLFSWCLPADFCYKMDDVEIIHAKLINGQLNKKTIGATPDSIIHQLYNDYSPIAAAKFINSVNFLMRHFMLHHSMSVGIADCKLPLKALEEIDDLCESIEPSKEDVVKMISRGSEISSIVKKNVSLRHNNLLKMSSAGSKGSMLNLMQVAGAVGQQQVDGKFIPKLFKDRILPHYEKGHDTLASKGFVRNSFYKGLSPDEFFSHAISGRTGLISTAVKTATSGYLQRKLTKSLENMKVTYDNTVRNWDNRVVQFLYGEDGFDATSLENETTGRNPHEKYILGLREDKYISICLPKGLKRKKLE